MMTPRRRRTMRRAAAWATRNVPLRLTSMMRSHVASESSRNGTIGSTAALVTATSIRPQARSIASKPSRTEAESATSIWSASAFARPIRRAAACAVVGSMSATATLAPSRAKASAMAWPIPRPAPVTSATWPLSFIAHLIRHENEIHLHARLAGARVELGDERFVTGRGHADVEVERATGVAAREVGLVAVAPRAVRALGGPVLGVVVAARIGGPPLEPGAGQGSAARRRRDPPRDHEPATGGRALRGAGLVERAQHVGPRRRARGLG